MRHVTTLALMWATSTPALGAPLLQAEEARGRRPIETVPAPSGAAVVFFGGTVLTATGDRLSPGYVVVEEGRVSAVGEGEAPQVDGARRVDLDGGFLTPGLIDTHSHLGVYPSPASSGHRDGNEMTSPTTPGVWAEHSVWPQDPGFEYAVAGGITALQILPGSANLVGGRGVVMRPVPTRGSRGMRFPGAPETVKMACGENPKRVYGEKKRAPSTRMGNLRGQREAFLSAERYRRTWSEYEAKRARWEEQSRSEKRKVREQAGSEPEPPKRDLDEETLALVLDGQILPQVHCYQADDMLSMLQLADEFGFSIRSFHHAVEAYKIADLLADKQVAASVWPEWWGFKLEAHDAIPENAAMLEAAGGIPVIHSDSPVTIQRLNQEAAKAYTTGRAAGLDVDEDDALRWITYNPAWALGIHEETGSIEVGKRADLVVWDRHPLSVYATAQAVYIDGDQVFEAGEPVPWSDFSLGQEVAP
jgi:imidazolonepropionase-like amidohydrolase